MGQRRLGAYVPERLFEYRSLLLGSLKGEEKLVELMDKLFRLEP